MMKCPFRITKTIKNHYVDNVFSATHGKIGSVTESIEFAECLEKDCPYYGKTVMKHRQSGGYEFVTDSACRKVEDDD